MTSILQIYAAKRSQIIRLIYLLLCTRIFEHSVCWDSILSVFRKKIIRCTSNIFNIFKIVRLLVLLLRSLPVVFNCRVHALTSKLDLFICGSWSCTWFFFDRYFFREVFISLNDNYYFVTWEYLAPRVSLYNLAFLLKIGSISSSALTCCVSSTLLSFV